MEWIITEGFRLLEKAAVLMNNVSRLLKHTLPPVDPNTALPTPSAAPGQLIQQSYKTVVKAKVFLLLDMPMIHRHCSSQAAADFHDVLQELNTSLMHTPYDLIGGHLPNLELDVTALMR